MSSTSSLSTTHSESFTSKILSRTHSLYEASLRSASRAWRITYEGLNQGFNLITGICFQIFSYCQPALGALIYAASSKAETFWIHMKFTHLQEKFKELQSANEALEKQVAQLQAKNQQTERDLQATKTAFLVVRPPQLDSPSSTTHSWNPSPSSFDEPLPFFLKLISPSSWPQL